MMKQLVSEADKAYFAGIVDGDGSVYVTDPNGHPYVVVNITNVFLPLLEIIQNLYGGSIRLDARSVAIDRKHDWSLTIQTDSIKFLKDIYPYSIIKKEQIELILNANNDSDWDEIMDSLHSMKLDEYLPHMDLHSEVNRIIDNNFTDVSHTLVYAYIAGLIDTDGSIYVDGNESNTKTWTMCINVANSYAPILYAIQKFLGGRGSVRNADVPGRHAWNYRLVSRQALELITKILPHLHIKRDRARHALEFQAQKQSGRNQYTPQAEKDLAYSKQIRSQRLMKALQNIRFPDEEKAIKYLQLAPVY